MNHPLPLQEYFDDCKKIGGRLEPTEYKLHDYKLIFGVKLRTVFRIAADVPDYTRRISKVILHEDYRMDGKK